jgi:hypothetical protein
MPAMTIYSPDPRTEKPRPRGHPALHFDERPQEHRGTNFKGHSDRAAAFRGGQRTERFRAFREMIYA